MSVAGMTKLFLAELRAPFFTATLAPICLGAAIAWSSEGVFSWLLFALTLLAGVLLHAGTNVANDYFDHRNRCDELNTEYIRPFTGGSRLIQLGLLTPRQVITYSLVLFAGGAAIGMYLVFRCGLPVLWLGLIGAFSGFFYSAPPIQFANRGLGELVVGVNFGVLESLGAFYVQTGYFRLEPAIAAIPITILIATVLYINQFPDFAADRAAGKRNLVVRFGRERGVYGYVALLVVAYASVVGGVLAQLISPFTLIVLVTLPLAVRSARVAFANYDRSPELTPANAGTVMVHLLVGVLLSVGYIIHRLVAM